MNNHSLRFNAAELYEVTCMKRRQWAKFLISRERWQRQWGDIKDIIDLIFSSNLPRLVVSLFLVCLLGGTAILVFENGEAGFGSVLDSMWWALVTMTTVGYGDKVPMSLGGRLLASFVMLSGVAIVSLFTATVSSLFVAKKLREERGLQKVFFKDHFVILGWNASGLEAVETLINWENPEGDTSIVLVSDLSQELIEEYQQRFTAGNLTFLKGDYTGTAVLNRAQVADARAVLILPDSGQSPEIADERTVLATLAVKSVSPRAKVLVQVIRRQSEGHLRRAGADKVIIADKYTGQLLANCAVAPNISRVLDSLLDVGHGPYFKSLKLSKESVGWTFEELSRRLKRTQNCILVGFVTEESILQVDDILSADISSVDAFIQKKLLQAGHSPEELETAFINLNPPLDYKVKENDYAIVVVGR